MRHVCPRMLFFLIALAGGTACMGGRFGMAGVRACGPRSLRKGSSHPAEDGLYSRLKKMPYLCDNKDAEFDQFAAADGAVPGGSGPLPEPTGSARALMAG